VVVITVFGSSQSSAYVSSDVPLPLIVFAAFRDMMLLISVDAVAVNLKQA